MVKICDLNRSISLGEQHDSEGGTDGSGWKIVGESGQNSTSISVGSSNSAPNGLY